MEALRDLAFDIAQTLVLDQREFVWAGVFVAIGVALALAKVAQEESRGESLGAKVLYWGGAVALSILAWAVAIVVAEWIVDQCAEIERISSGTASCYR